MRKCLPSGVQAQAHMRRVWTEVFLSVRATIEVEREEPRPFIWCNDQVRSLGSWLLEQIEGNILVWLHHLETASKYEEHGENANCVTVKLWASTYPTWCKRVKDYFSLTINYCSDLCPWLRVPYENPGRCGVCGATSWRHHRWIGRGRDGEELMAMAVQLVHLVLFLFYFLLFI